MGKKVVVKLHDLIDEYNISMRELSRIADVRSEALNELANQQRQRIQLEHIEKIADALDIIDIGKIIALVEVDDD
ncbi:helix-turn-helix transcriptional regulator [Bacillus sp. FJAT-29814]|uniref:helix-turn-helix domain-containing protein n=1 Tax=Bacillus sp. FJAT-29814 TaxID=1729688 RepID=UPI00083748DF|nr:helix-turn-helix transcriptional regulator [Bacillus sp. FJAT-29814]